MNDREETLPVFRHLADDERIVAECGKSFGSSRHGQPARMT
jgi:hypothetical protein